MGLVLGEMAKGRRHAFFRDEMVYPQIQSHTKLPAAMRQSAKSQ
jgi:hypothetical protein